MEDSAMFSRIQNARACLKDSELAALIQMETRLEVALAKRYGDQLSDATTKNLIASLAIQPEVMGTLMTDLNEMPESSSDWTKFAVNMVEQSEEATRDINYRNAAEIQALKNEILMEMRPEARISHSRSGYLDEFLNTESKKRLDERLYGGGNG